jgi:hypothetical protein
VNSIQSEGNDKENLRENLREWWSNGVVVEWWSRTTENAEGAQRGRRRSVGGWEWGSGF